MVLWFVSLCVVMSRVYTAPHTMTVRAGFGLQTPPDIESGCMEAFQSPASVTMSGTINLNGCEPGKMQPPLLQSLLLFNV